MYEPSDIVSGDVFGYSGTGFQAKAIQKFQAKEDEKSSFLNHTGIFVWLLFQDAKRLFVLNADYLPDYKLKAAVRLTPFEHFKDGKCYVLKRNNIMYPELYLDAITHFTGYPYDYINLLRNQIWLKLTGLWVGVSKHPQKKLICHEMTMTCENYYVQLINKEIENSGMPLTKKHLPFPDAEKGRVKDIFYSPLYYEISEI